MSYPHKKKISPYQTDYVALEWLEKQEKMKLGTKKSCFVVQELKNWEKVRF